MKVAFLPPNNNFNSSKNQHTNVNFEAGLTPKMMQEIQQADVLEISARLAKKGIPTNFKGNRAIAWCSEKALRIIEQLNERFDAKLAMPKGVFVEDFAELNLPDTEKSSYGFCNFRPTKLKKNSDEIVPAETVFFNSFDTFNSQVPPCMRLVAHDWNFINTIADFQYWTKASSTDHFLDLFMHEFSHVPHIDRMLQRFGGKTSAKKIDQIKSAEYKEEYKRKYGSKISQICDYALEAPPEAVACDMSRIIAECLDKETLMPTRNPFIGTPYERLSLLQRINIPYYSDEQRPLPEILRNFWNGNFD